jgi:hypothetical protein
MRLASPGSMGGLHELRRIDRKVGRIAYFADWQDRLQPAK